MLVVTRQEGQTFMILAGGLVIKVTLTKAGGSKVKLGIEAPDSVIILREELYYNRDRGPTTKSSTQRPPT